MKAFISYSMNEQDQILLSLLVRQLRSRKFVLRQSDDFSQPLSQPTLYSLQQAQLFVALIMENGSEQDRVLLEWEQALEYDVPSIILVENTVEMNSAFATHCIFFDRNRPDDAIHLLEEKINALNNHKKTQNTNAWAWTLGGAAVLGLLGTLAAKN